jgi:hypothetical protein
MGFMHSTPLRILTDVLTGGIAEGVYALSSSLKPKTPSAPGAPPAPPAPPTSQAATEEAAVAADNQRKAAAAAAGRQSTILTGGLGDYSLAPTKQRTLLGG